MIEALFPNAIADHNWIPKDRVRQTLTLFNHASDHNKYAAEIVAIERELGLNPAGSFLSVASRLDNFEFRISALEEGTGNDYVSRYGDTMLGLLSVPEFVIGNINTSQTGIAFNNVGYIRPLENFVNDAFKVQNILGQTLFEVPFNGAPPQIAGANILTTANHSHRTDAENNAHFWAKGDRIGLGITLSGYQETYREFVLPQEGTVRVTLNAAQDNHFKIRTNGANADIDIIGVPPRGLRRGITICVQNLGNSPVNFNLLNSHSWADFSPVPDLTTNPGRDTEVFVYTIGEGDRWVVHPYYINALVRHLEASFPTQLARHYKLYGRLPSTNTLSIPEEFGGAKLNLVNGTVLTSEGAQFLAANNRYAITDKFTSINLQGEIAIAALVKNIVSVEDLGCLVSLASSVRETNHFRVDALANRRLRARISSQNGSYENATTDNPAMPVATTNDTWTLVLGVKTDSGYGVYNVNLFAAGEDQSVYYAFRPFPSTTPVFDDNGEYRLGSAIVPRSSYLTNPVGRASFICGGLYILTGSLTGADIMSLYRAIRQDMLGLGLSSLPAPKI